MTVGIEKRKSGRVIKRLEVQYETGVENTAITSDLSETGLFIRTNRIITSENVLRIKLNLPNLQGFSLQGKVVRNKHTAPGLVGEAKSGVGVELVDPPQDYINYIRSLPLN